MKDENSYSYERRISISLGHCPVLGFTPLLSLFPLRDCCHPKSPLLSLNEQGGVPLPIIWSQSWLTGPKIVSGCQSTPLLAEIGLFCRNGIFRPISVFSRNYHSKDQLFRFQPKVFWSPTIYDRIMTVFFFNCNIFQLHLYISCDTFLTEFWQFWTYIG